MAHCIECDSRICDGCDTSVIHCPICNSLYNPLMDTEEACPSCMIKREAIWADSDKYDSDIFDSKRTITVSFTVTISGQWNDWEPYEEEKEFNRNLPCLIALKKEDFDADCSLKITSNYYWFYAPIIDDTYGDYFSYSKYDNIRISYIAIKIGTNKSMLDLIWD
jgi:hypothetical protein